MALGKLKGLKISGITCALPTRKIENGFFADYYGDKFVKRFERSTGIKARYWVHSKQTASDLCLIAAKNILQQKRMPAENIDALIFVSQTPDYKTPSTAFVLQKRLAMRKEAIVFDVNMGCTAVVHGLVILGSMIQSGVVKNGLLLIGDALPGREVTEDHNASMMFSDAGGAILLEQGQEEISYLLESDGEGFQAIMNPQGERFPINKAKPDWRVMNYYMDGGQVFNFATATVPKAFQKYNEYFGKKDSDFDYYVFHQANSFIIRHISNDMNILEEKVPLSICKYANTNGASIVVTIVDMLEQGLLQRKKHIVICGFGIGLSWGIMDFDIDSKCVFPILYSDEYDKEGTKIQYLQQMDLE